MDLNQIISFALVSAIFVAVPGPNVLVIVSTTLSSGKLRGLQTVLGTSMAMIIQLTIAGLGTSILLSTLSQGLVWLKWAGVAYLFFLGINSLHAFCTRKKSVQPSAATSIQRGFWVSLTNPKTILFFSAFLPQFAEVDSPYLPQIAILSICFFVVAIIIDSGYAIMSARLKWLLAARDMDRISNGVSGTFYIGAGGLLASTNKL